MSSKGENIEEDNEIQEEIIRFMQDLEFVQCLSNPFYLKYLSNNGYFDDENFVNYLQYLLYFKRAEYMKYITFERSIIFLELLQYKEFRQKLKDPNYEILLENFITNDWLNRNETQIVQNNEDIKENQINDNNIKMDVEN